MKKSKDIDRDEIIDEARTIIANEGYKPELILQLYQILLLADISTKLENLQTTQKWGPKL